MDGSTTSAPRRRIATASAPPCVAALAGGFEIVQYRRKCTT
jgi:hypothetical protein